MTAKELFKSYDYREAWDVACHDRRVARIDGSVSLSRPTKDDIVDVLAISEGQNEGADWLILARLRDERYVFVAAGCDFTGWDCQASGIMTFASSIHELLGYGLTDEQTTRVAMGIV